MMAIDRISIQHAITEMAMSFTMVIVFFFIAACPAWAQAKLKPVGPADYHLWSKLLFRDVSYDGKWISYLLMYESGKDTLFLKAVDSNISYSFPHVRQGTFCDHIFACMSADTLMLRNLKHGGNRMLPGISEFKFIPETKQLIIIKNQKNLLKALVIQDLSGTVLKEIPDVNNWHISGDQKTIAYSSEISGQSMVRVMNLDKKLNSSTILQDAGGTINGIVSENGVIVFAITINGTTRLQSYNIPKRQLKICPGPDEQISLNGLRIGPDAASRVVISDDGKRIFFWLKEAIESQIDDSVQVWNTADRVVFSNRKLFGDIRDLDKLMVWDLVNGTLRQVTDKQHPKVFLNGDQTYAFVYDPDAYEPQSDFNSPIDLYAVNTQTGEKGKAIEKIPGGFLPIASPDGKYIAYHKDSHLWIYHVREKKTIKVEDDAGFFKPGSMPGAKTPYGIAGWSSRDGHLIIYDRFDLWKTDMNGKSIRLTKGKERGKVYRLNKPLYGTEPRRDEVLPAPAINLAGGLVLTASDVASGDSGFYWWKPGHIEKEIVWKDRKVNQIVRSASGRYFYVEQKYDLAPRIQCISDNAEERSLVETNMQQQKFAWGRARLVHYEYDGKKLSGVLYFPADYHKDIKYPMIVHIYEKQSQYLNDYINPTIHSGDGFNVTRLSAQGYFVLLPDIHYEFGNLAKSVTGSLLSAVDAVIGMENIDADKIGLIGHSFGGYETDLVITQTDRFATAVAGAAWTDIVSTYLYVGESFRKPDFYRTEFDQLRIGKSLYEGMAEYLRNSPVLLAESVTTPLLGWTGEEDRHVNALQSLEFYLALRRLQKEHILLIYPKEGHNLHKKQNQQDLASKIEQWFGYYLQCKEPPAWISANR